mgnify:CR=1 FL=1
MTSITSTQTATTRRLRALGYKTRNALGGTVVDVRPTLQVFILTEDNAYRGETHDHGVVSHFTGWNFTRLREYLARF